MHWLVVALVHQQIRMADVAMKTKQKNDVTARGDMNQLIFTPRPRTDPFSNEPADLQPRPRTDPFSNEPADFQPPPPHWPFQYPIGRSSWCYIGGVYAVAVQ